VRSCCRVRETIAPNYRGLELGWSFGDPWQRTVSEVHKMHTKPPCKACSPLEVVHHTPNCILKGPPCPAQVPKHRPAWVLLISSNTSLPGRLLAGHLWWSAQAFF
jgi:hypothetical protein